MAHKLYRIGDAAELLGLKTYVLRYWETEFFQLRPVRTGKGQRRYTEADVAMLGHIRYLLHDQGLTIEGARRVLAGDSALSLKDAPPPAASEAQPGVVDSVPSSVSGSVSDCASDRDTRAAEAAVQPAPQVREKHAGKPVQLSLNTCFTDACPPAMPPQESGPMREEKYGQPSAQNEDGRGEAIRRIADELRALRSLLRKG